VRRTVSLLFVAIVMVLVMPGVIAHKPWTRTIVSGAVGPGVPLSVMGSS
jgi:hypothetical protein